MSQLTDISVQLRKVGIWAGIIILSIIMLQYLVRIIVAALKKPPPPEVVIIIPTPTPDIRFGKLPYPKFSVVERTTSGLTFELINVEGKPPEATRAAYIYAMPKKVPSLLSNERAIQFATKLGFTAEPRAINSRVSLYTAPEDPLLFLRLDRVNLNFSLMWDWKQDPLRFFSTENIQTAQAKQNITAYISAQRLFDDTMLKGKQTVSYVRYDDPTKKLVPESRSARAHGMRIDFFRPDINAIPLVPPAYEQSTTYALYSVIPTPQKGIVELVYTFWPIAYDNSATYPLKTSEQAWEEIKKGFGTVVTMGTNTGKKIVVRTISIAYYDSADPQQYLQPIFVLTGDNGFVAYLPAVPKEHLE